MRDIKLIIFDLDGTLYNLDDVVKMNYKMQLDFYSEYTGFKKNEVVKIFEKNYIFPTITAESKSATEFFVKNGVQATEWNAYREIHFDVTAIQKEDGVKQSLMNEFKRIAPLILLSSNSFNNIIKILSYLEIDKSIFDEIICSDNKSGNGAFKKITEMVAIAKKRNISTANMFSIGDRFKTDIAPILELGGMGMVVKGPEDVAKLLDDFNKS